MAAAAPPKRLKKDLPTVKVYVHRLTQAFKTDCNYLCAMIQRSETFANLEEFRQTYFWAHNVFSRLETFAIFVAAIRQEIVRNQAILDEPIDPSAADATDTIPKTPPGQYRSVIARHEVLRSYADRIQALLKKIFEFRNKLEADGLL